MSRKNGIHTVDYDFCTRILQTLMKHPDAEPFLQEVDPVHDCAPDYLERVKNPMDLGTLQQKLQKSFFAVTGQITKQQFLTDLNLIWSNAELYNGKNHYITKQAENLQELVQKIMLKEKSHSETPTKTPPAKKIKKEPTPKKEAATVVPLILQPVIIQPPEPELNFSEKSELCAIVASLDPAYMEEVISLIHANCANIFKGVTEKYTIVELNLDNLEPSFQIKLLAYVKDIARKKEFKDVKNERI
jgi:hypothetical protein